MPQDDPAAPSFPPLFHGLALQGPAADPFVKACSQAIIGCDSGLVVHNISAERLRAAIVFAPETALAQAMPVLIACQLGFQNALGALAPPEVAVHLKWTGEILVNGARCGHFRVAAALDQPEMVPDWLVVGLEVPLIPPDANAPGATPDQTGLSEEGCTEVDAAELLGAWVRHSLVWINAMQSDGNAALHKEWRGLAKDLGEDVAFELNGQQYQGQFMGVDEDFGMLLRLGGEMASTQVVPLSACLENGENE